MLDLALRAIVEPRRRDILRLVQDVELPAGEIASHFDVTRPAISQHLRVLLDSGLVQVRRDGTRHLYTARPEGTPPSSMEPGAFSCYARSLGL